MNGSGWKHCRNRMSSRIMMGRPCACHWSEQRLIEGATARRLVVFGGAVIFHGLLKKFLFTSEP